MARVGAHARPRRDARLRRLPRARTLLQPEPDPEPEPEPEPNPNPDQVPNLNPSPHQVQPFFHPLGESLPAVQQIVAFPQGLLFAVPTVIGFIETSRSQRWTGNEVIRNVLPRSADGRYLGASGVGAQGSEAGDVGYDPGDLGFDPLGVLPGEPAARRAMQVRARARDRG